MSGARFVLKTTNESSLTLRKPRREAARGNYFFEAEASNENIDLHKQIVLQRALLDSKDVFLKQGAISFNHLHIRKGSNGQTISDPSMIIGEPIEVRTEGKKTIVKGKLYHTSKMAQEIIKALKSGSPRIKASIGSPRTGVKIEHDIKTGIETVTRFTWNDLALTLFPVNPTVSPVRLMKRSALK
jgi:hypothetical protein